MDTFDRRLSLRYGNYKKEGKVVRIRHKSQLVDLVPVLRSRNDVESHEYLMVSYGRLNGFGLDSEGQPGEQLWSLTLHSSKVSCDSKGQTVTVAIARSSRKSEAVRQWLQEPAESKIVFRSPQYLEWFQVLSSSAVAEIGNFYERKRTIGTGNFAVVYSGIDLKTEEPVAVKVMRKDKEQWQKFFAREMDILKCVDHPNIVRTIDIFETRKKIYIVMEKMEGGKLFDRIVEHKTISEENCKDVMRDVLQGLMYLHSHNIVHRDVKPDNVLCTQKEPPFGCKLADFGLSNFIEEKYLASMGSDELLTSAVGTPLYVAPEIIEKRQYGPAVDVWAAGILMYVMLSGRLPFKADDKKELFNKVRHKDVAFPDDHWHDVSDNAKNLIRSMLQRDPKRRLAAGAALHHDWFSTQHAGPSLGYKLTNLSSHDLAADANYDLNTLKGAVQAVVLANRAKKLFDVDGDNEVDYTIPFKRHSSDVT